MRFVSAACGVSALAISTVAPAALVLQPGQNSYVSVSAGDASSSSYQYDTGYNNGTALPQTLTGTATSGLDTATAAAGVLSTGVTLTASGHEKGGAFDNHTETAVVQFTVDTAAAWSFATTLTGDNATAGPRVSFTFALTDITTGSTSLGSASFNSTSALPTYTTPALSGTLLTGRLYRLLVEIDQTSGVAAGTVLNGSLQLTNTPEPAIGLLAIVGAFGLLRRQRSNVR